MGNYIIAWKKIHTLTTLNHIMRKVDICTDTIQAKKKNATFLDGTFCLQRKCYQLVMTSLQVFTQIFLGKRADLW